MKTNSKFNFMLIHCVRRGHFYIFQSTMEIDVETRKKKKRK